MNVNKGNVKLFRSTQLCINDLKCNLNPNELESKCDLILYSVSRNMSLRTFIIEYETQDMIKL